MKNKKFYLNNNLKNNKINKLKGDAKLIIIILIILFCYKLNSSIA